MRTLVVQSFRKHDVPEWISRCLSSVESWAALRGYEYELIGDEIFELCGADYLRAVGPNMQSITNLARLIVTRHRLEKGIDRVIWFDADVFVFGPHQLSIDVKSGYAFSRETWMVRRKKYGYYLEQNTHNAAFVFAENHADLSFLILAINHIAKHRQIRSNFQLGVKLLTGLKYSLDFPHLLNVGAFSPDIIRALARNDRLFLSRFAQIHESPVYAANLGLSLDITPDEMNRAMEALTKSEGRILNRWLERNLFTAIVNFVAKLRYGLANRITL
jgi:hypothetical protein